VDGGDDMGLDGDGAELRAGWAGGAQEDFHAQGAREDDDGGGHANHGGGVTGADCGGRTGGVDAYNKDI
jgi:hypothetical protein